MASGKIKNNLRYVDFTNETTNSDGRIEKNIVSLGYGKPISVIALSPNYAVAVISNYNSTPVLFYFYEALSKNALANTSVSFRVFYM